MKICPICKSEYGSGEIFCPNDGSRLSSRSQYDSVSIDPNDPLVGLVLGGRYRVIKAIGEGGMGIVYEGVHEVIEKKVAIKVLRDDFSKRPEVVERFRQEAKSASRIGHEHIVDISDFGETPNGQSYFVMEFLAGADLADILAAEGTIAPARAVNIIIQCCKALGAAHAKGIIHRDMKPENIFLTSRDDEPDFVKIVDFGIAKMSDIETDGAPGRKLTKTGMIFGTPEYMSPEQAAGKPLDHRVDVYALGVILFEMLTGRVPFVGDTFMGILTQHMFEDIPALEVVNPNVQCSEELAVVIYKTMSKDADERYPDMPALGRAVAAAMELDGVFSVDTMVGWGEVSSPGKRISIAEGAATIEMEPTRGRAKLFALVGVGMLLIAGVIGGYLAFQPPSTAANGASTLTNVGNEPLVPDDGTMPLAGVADASQADVVVAAAESPDAAAEAPSAVDMMMVTIEVVTRPDGAEIMVGGEVVCDPSPCTFEAEVGRSIRIQARKGNLMATRDLEPGQAMAIEMQLDRRPRRHDRNGQMTAGMRPAMMSGSSHNDLKTPSIFQMSR